MLRAAILVTVATLLFASTPVQVAHAEKLPAQQEGCDSSEDPACNPITTNTEEHDAEIEQPDVPVVTTIYVTETIIVEEIVPVEEIVVVEQIVPVTETVYVEEVVTVIVTEVVPVEQIVIVEQIVPVTETVYVKEVVTTVVTEVVPVEEIVTIEQIIPITQTIFVTETITAQPAPSPTPSPATDSVTTTTGITTSQAIGVALAQPAALHHWSQLLPPYDAPTPLPVTGLAMYYAPNVMDGVEAYRERVNGMAECEECVGQVALLRAGDLGRKVWIRVGDGAAEGPFQVMDVAARHHIPDLLRRNWVVDVDYTTAVRWGMQGPVMVTVYGEAPAHATVTQSVASAEITPQ